LRLLSAFDDYKALKETAEVLADPDVCSALEVGLEEIGQEDTIPFTELRKELAERRSSVADR
jgi:hypothetical protein